MSRECEETYQDDTETQNTDETDDTTNAEMERCFNIE